MSDEPMPVASVRVDFTNAAPMPGQSSRALVTLRDAALHVVDARTLTFASADETIATVDENGLITALSVGVVDIAATCEGVTGAATLSVLEDVGQFDALPLRTYAVISATRLVQITPAHGEALLRSMHEVDDVVDITDLQPRPALWSWYDGTSFTPPSAPTIPARVLAEEKIAVRTAINASCDAFRAQFVTNITAQDVVYDKKALEADAITAMLGAGGNPFSNENRLLFRFINDEAIAKNESIMTIYQLVASLKTQWMELLYMTEKKRQGLMGQIDTAANVDALPSTTVNWSQPW